MKFRQLFKIWRPNANNAQRCHCAKVEPHSVASQAASAHVIELVLMNARNPRNQPHNTASRAALSPCMSRLV